MTEMTPPDCTAAQPTITLTWNAIADSTWDAAEIARMKQIAEAVWNANPFKYGNCVVKFVANIKAANSVPPAQQGKYDRIKRLGAGDDFTTGPNSPDGQHTVNLNEIDHISHEMGHCLGLEDSTAQKSGGMGQKTGNWDKNGITAAHIHKIVWAGKGWDIKAACCKPGSGYYADHEVAVILHRRTVTSGSGASVTSRSAVFVKAWSLDHSISEIQVWSHDGSYSWMWGNYPNATVHVDDIHGKDRQSHQLEFELEDLKADHFPLCVDVYEEGDASEPADGHRHGWFGSSCNPTSAKGHIVDPARMTPRTEGYYPSLGGEVHGDNHFPQPNWEDPNN